MTSTEKEWSRENVHCLFKKYPSECEDTEVEILVSLEIVD